MKMNVKQAVRLAKEYLLDLYTEENIENLGLEEIEYDEREREWIITLGFSRPWDEPRNPVAVLVRPISPPRTYKVLRISENSEQVTSVKNREIGQ